jgi:hypothetical protein
MPTSSRKAAIGKGTEGTYRVYSRCLDHVVLDGLHPESGKKITHRRRWIAERVAGLQEHFAVRVEVVVVKGSEVDLILTCLPEVAAKWSPEEVVWRWSSLFGTRLGVMDRTRLSALAGKKPQIGEWRTRLTSVSWFMRAFNEWLARIINKEEGRRGQFWDGRFRCQRLGKEEVAQTVADFEGFRVPVPAYRDARLAPALRSLPDAPPPPKKKKAGRNVRVGKPWLTVEQKMEIARRLAEGEKAEDLAAEFGRHPATILKLKKPGPMDVAAIAGSRLAESEKRILRKLALRQKPRRARNGRLVFHPIDVHSLAEKTFGRNLAYEPFHQFCRELRQS